MEKLYIDLPDALENISEVIKRCNFHLDTSSHHLPKFKTPNDVTIDEHFNNLVTEGLLNIRVHAGAPWSYFIKYALFHAGKQVR